MISQVSAKRQGSKAQTKSRCRMVAGFCYMIIALAPPGAEDQAACTRLTDCFYYTASARRSRRSVVVIVQYGIWQEMLYRSILSVTGLDKHNRRIVYHSGLFYGFVFCCFFGLITPILGLRSRVSLILDFNMRSTRSFVRCL